MPANAFFVLCESIVGVGHPFLEKVKLKRAAGIKEDATAELSSTELDKLMELKKKWEGKDDKRD